MKTRMKLVLAIIAVIIVVAEVCPQFAMIFTPDPRCTKTGQWSTYALRLSASSSTPACLILQHPGHRLRAYSVHHVELRFSTASWCG